MSPLCELLGITRQGFYKHVDKVSEECILITSIVLYSQHIRAPDNLPKAGCRELLELNRQYFGKKFTLGRDRFYDVLRANGLMLRNKRYRPRTTDSNHNNRIYPDLLNTTPKLVAKRPENLWLLTSRTFIAAMDSAICHCLQMPIPATLSVTASSSRLRRKDLFRLCTWLTSALRASESVSWT